MEPTTSQADARNKIQKTTADRNYIVDFVCFEKRVVIELDGSQHAIDSIKDEERDKHLTKNGYCVLRFWDNEVFENIEGVLEVIMQKCHK